jgi:flavin reductase (DIM6/NTAB) family NADH-FMN oxidoreductase RutF
MTLHTTVPMPESQAWVEEFKETMRFMPAPVSVVTALDEQGMPRGLTCSAVCSLSMAPPSMLVCVNRQNRSLDAIRYSGGFLVNLLRAGRDEMSEVMASSDPSKFVGAQWQPSPSSGLPLLATDALAFVDCDLQAEIMAGSHAILIGLVRGTGTETPDSGPLVYWRRSYGGWAAQEILEGAQNVTS